MNENDYGYRDTSRVILHHLLRASGLTLRAFAKKVGVSPSHLSLVLSGRRGMSPAMFGNTVYVLTGREFFKNAYLNTER